MKRLADSSEETHWSLRGLPFVGPREEHLIAACRGRRVAHFGCADSGWYGASRRAGDLLHARLGAAAARLFGVDVAADNLARMRADGFTGLFCRDVSSASDRAALEQELRAEGGVDLIVCGEVIEHVPDPVALLRGLIELGRAFGAETIVTTPNPFYYGAFVRAAGGSERVHPDHNCYISAGTFMALYRKAGGQGEVRVLLSSQKPPGALAAAAKAAILALFPTTADSLIFRFAG